jgi:hypothetical protein
MPISSLDISVPEAQEGFSAEKAAALNNLCAVFGWAGYVRSSGTIFLYRSFTGDALVAGHTSHSIEWWIEQMKRYESIN